MNEKMAIVILNYKSYKETLEEAYLCNALFGVAYEDVIVVDNASPNDSAEMLSNASKNQGFVFLKSDRNSGYAAGNNIGLRYAFEHGYKYAWILNNDIIIEDKDIIEKLIAVFRSNKTIAVVNPDIYAPDGHMYNRDAKRPTFFDLTIGMYSYKKIGRDVDDLGGYAYIYRPQGCCMMVDLEKMNEIDYMDEHTFLYCEEPILAERLLKKGYRCACCLTASIIHNHSVTVKSTFDKKRIRKMNNTSLSYCLRQYRNFNKVQVKVCCLFNSLKFIALEGI